MLIPYVPAAASKKALQFLLKHETSVLEVVGYLLFSAIFTMLRMRFSPGPPFYTPPPRLSTEINWNPLAEVRGFLFYFGTGVLKN